MLKKVTSVLIIIGLLYSLFAGAFAHGQKQGSGEFIEEEVISQEYVAPVAAEDKVIGYKVSYDVVKTGGTNTWTTHLELNETDGLQKGDDSSNYNDMPDCRLIAQRLGQNGNIEIYGTKALSLGVNTFDLNKGTNENPNNNDPGDEDAYFDGPVDFAFTVTVTQVTIKDAIEEITEVPQIKEIYITGYKITSGKYTGYSVMFAEKILKCTITTTGLGAESEKSETKYSKYWHKLKCLDFGIYVKKTCKWDKGYLFKYKCWKHNGVYVNVENEQVIKINLDADKGNQYQGSSESNSSSSSSSSSNEEYYSSSSSSGSSDDANSSADDDKTVYSDSLPKTGESVPVYGMIVGGLLLLIGTIILLRKKIVNKIMR